MACNSPIRIIRNGVPSLVPCRWCMGCRIARRSEWALRMRLEAFDCYTRGLGSSFVTFTYDDSHYNGNADLQDMQLMNKRLRYYLSKNPKTKNLRFKYYICSEYGDNTERGHFHGIYFGLSDRLIRDFLRKSWKKGFVLVKPVCSAHFRYVLKYMDKQTMSDEDKQVYISIYKRCPPSRIMSKGIALSYFKNHINELVENNGLFVDGKVRALNTYYARKLGLDVSDERFNIIKGDMLKAQRKGVSYREYVLDSAYKREINYVHQARNHGFVVTNEDVNIALLNLQNCKSSLYGNLDKQVDDLVFLLSHRE